MRIKGFISLMLASFLALSLCACAKADGTDVVSSSKPNEPEKEWREPAEKENNERFIDTDGDFAPDAEEAVFDGAYHESYFQSAPYFALSIDGIEWLNSAF